MTTRHVLIPIALFLLAAPVLSGCVAARVAGTTADVAVFAGKTAVKGTVGAGRLAARGSGAVVRDLRANREDFPAGTPVCADGRGNFFTAPLQEDGSRYCPS